MEETEFTLRDGTKALLRPAEAGDRQTIEAFYNRLTDRSLFLRFHREPRRLPERELDPHNDADELLLLAWHGGRIIVLASYRRSAEQADHGDIAIAVEDSHQHLGVATYMLWQLAASARRNGISVFQADILAENKAMLDLLRDSGVKLTSSLKYGTYHVSFPLGDDPPSA